MPTSKARWNRPIYIATWNRIWKITYFIVCTKVDKRAGQLSLPHVGKWVSGEKVGVIHRWRMREYSNEIEISWSAKLQITTRQSPFRPNSCKTLHVFSVFIVINSIGFWTLGPFFIHSTLAKPPCIFPVFWQGVGEAGSADLPTIWSWGQKLHVIFVLCLNTRIYHLHPRSLPFILRQQSARFQGGGVKVNMS